MRLGIHFVTRIIDSPKSCRGLIPEPANILNLSVDFFAIKTFCLPWWSTKRFILLDFCNYSSCDILNHYCADRMMLPLNFYILSSLKDILERYSKLFDIEFW